MKCTRVFSHWSGLWAGLLFLFVSANAQNTSLGSGSGYLAPFINPSSTMSDVMDYTSDDFADKTKLEATTTTSKTSNSVPTMLPTLTFYIEISLKISLEEYLKQCFTLNSDVLIVLKKFLPTDFTTMKRAASEIYYIIVTLDEQKSSNHTSFLQVYIVKSETEQEDSEATEQFFYLLASKSANFTAQLEAAINIVSRLQAHCFTYLEHHIHSDSVALLNCPFSPTECCGCETC